MFYKFLIFLLSQLPLSAFHFVGDCLAFLWIKVLRIRKDVIFSNLQMTFPELDENQKNEIAIISVQNLTKSFAHLFLLPQINEEWVEKHVEFIGFENYLNASRKNKGVYFLTLHMGSGDLAMSSMVLKGIPMVLISKKMSNSWFQALWSKLRTVHGLEIIDPHSPQNAFQILNAIKKNKAVVFVLDQFMGPPYGIKSNFFGIQTGTAYGLSVFAKKTQSPILPIYTYWESPTKMKIIIEAELNIDLVVDNETKDQSTLRITEIFNKKIEQIVRQYPQHWMWVHKRWKVFR
jgi:KDO2-lipid IV(A) lauroyltransferase